MDLPECVLALSHCREQGTDVNAAVPFLTVRTMVHSSGVGVNLLRSRIVPFSAQLGLATRSDNVFVDRMRELGSTYGEMYAPSIPEYVPFILGCHRLAIQKWICRYPLLFRIAAAVSHLLSSKRLTGWRWSTTALKRCGRR